MSEKPLTILDLPAPMPSAAGPLLAHLPAITGFARFAGRRGAQPHASNRRKRRRPCSVRQNDVYRAGGFDRRSGDRHRRGDRARAGASQPSCWRRWRQSKHVYCEWPLGPKSWARRRKWRTPARKAGVHVVIGTQGPRCAGNPVTPRNWCVRVPSAGCSACAWSRPAAAGARLIYPGYEYLEDKRNGATLSCHPRRTYAQPRSRRWSAPIPRLMPATRVLREDVRVYGIG